MFRLEAALRSDSRRRGRSADYATIITVPQDSRNVLQEDPKLPGGRTAALTRSGTFRMTTIQEEASLCMRMTEPANGSTVFVCDNVCWVVPAFVACGTGYVSGPDDCPPSVFGCDADPDGDDRQVQELQRWSDVMG